MHLKCTMINVHVPNTCTVLATTDRIKVKIGQFHNCSGNCNTFVIVLDGTIRQKS